MPFKVHKGYAFKTPYTGKTIKKSRRKYTRSRKGGLVSLIKKVALQNNETKTSGHATDTYTAPAQYFITNNKTVMGLVNCLGTSTGAEDAGGMESSDLNRVGDSIFAKGIKFSVWLETVSDRQNTSFGIVAFWYNPRILPYTQKIQPAGSPQPADLAPQFWRGKDGSGSEMCRFLDVIDSNKVKVIKHIRIKPRSGGNYFENTGSSPPDRQNCPHAIEFYCKLDKKIKYRDDDEKTPQWRDIGLAIYAYNQSTALSTDNVGIVSCSSLLYYKDP